MTKSPGNLSERELQSFFKALQNKIGIYLKLMEKVILASQSPRRKQLLEWAEIPFDVIAKSTDESFPAELSVEEVPIFIARNKAVGVKKYLAEKSEYAGETIL